jgi:hypothetical protein
VLFVGGVGGGLPRRRETLVYDVAADRWADGGLLNNGRVDFNLVRLSDGRVLATAGAAAGTAAEVYEPRTGVWSPTGPFNAADHGAAACVALPGGRAVLTAEDADGGPAPAELYDSSTNGWQLTAPFPSGGSDNLTGTLLFDGGVLFAGGGDLRAQAWLWRPPPVDSWLQLPPLQEGRIDHFALLLPDGAVMVLGGIPQAGVAIASSEVWAGGAWQPGPGLGFPDRGPQVVALPTGRYLHLGGSSAQNVDIASLELLSVWNEAVTPSPPLLEGRTGTFSSCSPTVACSSPAE